MIQDRDAPSLMGTNAEPSATRTARPLVEESSKKSRDRTEPWRGRPRTDSRSPWFLARFPFGRPTDGRTDVRTDGRTDGRARASSLMFAGTRESSSPFYLRASPIACPSRATLGRLSRRRRSEFGRATAPTSRLAPRSWIRSGFHEPSATSHTQVARAMSRVHRGPSRPPARPPVRPSVRPSVRRVRSSWTRRGTIIAHFAPITASKVAMVEKASERASEGTSKRASERARRRELPRTASSRGLSGTASSHVVKVRGPRSRVEGSSA